MKNLNVLMICTSHGKLGDTPRKTGAWLEEIAAPYFIFKDAGARITLASPSGGAIPIDPHSEQPDALSHSAIRFRHDMAAMGNLMVSTPLNEVRADEYDLVFIAGGHGAMWDFPDNRNLKALLENFNRQGKPIAAVCHGVAGLLNMEEQNGFPVLAGKSVTGFSNSEEEFSGPYGIMPFLLESRLRSIGAVYSKGHDHASHVVIDDNIVTGQNPSSSEETAEKVLGLIRESKMEYEDSHSF
ncbi:MAG TPA: type 1 glutamine amidotransferase domain-containing protein [Bacteroidia bacterium]|nr:type 1 glutamine amidotransferase domain-containing protein [Bacteroidia bacterium]